MGKDIASRLSQDCMCQLTATYSAPHLDRCSRPSLCLHPFDALHECKQLIHAARRHSDVYYTLLVAVG